VADLHGVLQSFVDSGQMPGAVGLVARGDEVEVAAVGAVDVDGTAPMTRHSIMRVASLTKPITAAAVMLLADEGRLALDDEIRRWLPELAEPVVVRRPDSPIDDVVPAARPITVADLLTSRAGWGFPSDFSLPAVQPLFTELGQGPPGAAAVPEPDVWLDRLARLPLLYQPGEAWLYNTCSDLQGILVARVSGRSLPEVLADRLFEPLGMTDTGFTVPAGSRDRFTSAYRPTSDGGLELAERADDSWHEPPAFPSGAGGLVSTVDDWLAFGRMLLADGRVGDRQLLSAASVRLMTTDHLTPAQRAAGTLFLEGQGWGFGGSVDIEVLDDWNVPGRYGWIGGTGTAAHIVPATGTVTILLTQRELTGPTSPPYMREFWRYAA
jgi:CubicO group peptidase (beta-lactamase class C family)